MFKLGNYYFILINRYLVIIHPIWHKTHFKIRWLFISFAIIWICGIAFNAAYLIPITEVRVANVWTSLVNAEEMEALFK